MYWDQLKSGTNKQIKIDETLLKKCFDKTFDKTRIAILRKNDLNIVYIEFLISPEEQIWNANKNINRK